jgi:hypothetical protein
MRRILNILIAGFLVQALSGASLVEKAQLQAAMQRHIERSLIDGALLHINDDTGKVERLFPSATHPQVLAAPDYYVLCVDLSDGAGVTRPADFYIAPRGEGCVVVKTAIDDRALLKRLMSDGVLSRM